MTYWKIIQKGSALLAVIVFLVGCSVVSTGAISIDGRPAKIELEEYTPNGIILEGFDVRIDSEFVGRAARIGISGPVGLRSTVQFAPFQSNYGEIRITQNINTSLVGSEISFDVYVDGTYAGSVQMPSI